MVRLLLHPAHHGRARLHPGAGLLPLRAHPPGAGQLDAGLLHLRLDGHALRRRHRHRDPVLRRRRAGRPVRAPAHRRRPDHPSGRPRPRGHRPVPVPLRHLRLGPVRPGGPGHGLLRLPTPRHPHAALHPAPTAGAAHRGRHRRHRRRRSPGRRGLRHRGLAGGRRRPAERGPQHPVRAAAGLPHPDRADRPGRHHGHRLGRLRRRPGRARPVHHQRAAGHRPGPVGAHHRRRRLPHRRAHRLHRGLLHPLPAADAGDLRLQPPR